MINLTALPVKCVNMWYENLVKWIISRLPMTYPWVWKRVVNQTFVSDFLIEIHEFMQCWWFLVHIWLRQISWLQLSEGLKPKTLSTLLWPSWCWRAPPPAATRALRGAPTRPYTWPPVTWCRHWSSSSSSRRKRSTSWGVCLGWTCEEAIPHP